MPYQRLGEEQFEPYLAEVAKIADKHGITWGGMFMGTPKPEHWEDRGGGSHYQSSLNGMSWRARILSPGSPAIGQRSVVCRIE